MDEDKKKIIPGKDEVIASCFTDTEKIKEMVSVIRGDAFVNKKFNTRFSLIRSKLGKYEQDFLEMTTRYIVTHFIAEYMVYANSYYENINTDEKLSSHFLNWLDREFLTYSIGMMRSCITKSKESTVTLNLLVDSKLSYLDKTFKNNKSTESQRLALLQTFYEFKNKITDLKIISFYKEYYLLYDNAKMWLGVKDKFFKKNLEIIQTDNNIDDVITQIYSVATKVKITKGDHEYYGD